jgi:hypothetical protein
MLRILFMPKIGGACRRHFNDDNFMKCLVRQLVGQRPLGRVRRRWKNNIEVNLKKEFMMNLTGLICHRTETKGGYF